MKAIILVAGYATRLYPLTLNTPKALLPINGKPIIDYIVEQVNTIKSIDCIYVVSNHKFAEQFYSWQSKKNNPVEIKIIDDGTEDEDTRRGAVGDIYFTVEKENIDDEVIIIAGDNFFTYSLLEYYEFYKNIKHDCVCVKKFEDREMIKQLGVALLDENNKVINIEEKPQNPKSDTAVFATYIYKKETVPLFKKYIEEGNKPDAPGYFVQWLYSRKDVYAYRMNGECYDIGTPKAYEEIQKIVK